MPSQDPLTALVDSALHLARSLETRPFDDERILPLTPVERLVIQHIDRHPGTSVREVAAAVALQPSNASATVTRLVDRDLVARTRGPGDARTATLSLTDTARASIGRVHAEWRGLLGHAEVGEGEVAAAVETLTALTDHLDALREGA